MKKLIIILTTLAFCQNVWSQEVSGFIFDQSNKKIPLSGVNVYWLNTTQGTFTDDKGTFRLGRKGINDQRLVISLLGYRKDTLTLVKGQVYYEIGMFPENTQLGTVEIKEKQDNTFISKLNARSTQVITTGELQRAACCNLAESFETNASVDVSYSDAITGAKQIQLLGLSGIYSQVMTENIPLLRGLASAYGLNYIPGPWMESIQISKGTASVENGYESVTGQINVEYKKPATSEQFYFNLYGNSNLRWEANADGAIKLNDKLSTMLMLHIDDFKNPFDRNHDGFMDMPKLTTYNVFNRWDYLNPGKMVSRLGIKYLDENRNGGQTSFDQSKWSTDTTGITNDTKPYGFNVSTKRLEAFWKNGFFIKDHPDASIGLILSGINHEQEAYYGISLYNAHERSLYANLIFQMNLAGTDHKLVTGLSYLLDDYKENYLQTQLKYLYEITGQLTDHDLFTLVDSNQVNYNLDRTEWLPGAFAEYTFKHKDKFTAILGMRVDYNNLYGTRFTPRLHLKYNITETAVIRGSVGKAYRTANVLTENSSIFVSQRKLFFVEDLKQEEAWNYGINFTKDFKLFNRKTELSIDAYRTSFINQVIVDADSLPANIFIYNLHGRSYANSIQAQVTSEPIKRFSVTLAFRVNDVKTTINHKLRTKPFVNKYKGLVSLSYATRFDKWKFDVTGQFNGSMRIPDTDKMPAKLRRADNSPQYFNLLAQITKKFKHFDVYVGGENITNFTQGDPIIEYGKPYHTHFDASMAWGPVLGWTAYAGIRMMIK